MNGILSIVILLAVIGVVLARLPKVDMGHSPEFIRRRFWNWFPLGMTYAFLYFGRYNLAGVNAELEKLGVLSKAQFNDIDAIGAATYGVAFLLNGPLTDRLGGRFTILLAAGGSAVCNVAMGILFQQAAGGGLGKETVVPAITLLNAVNMYFQSFGAVSIVKVNAPWFHVRERGVLGGVFGILISLGLYFGYDIGKQLFVLGGLPFVFFVPAAVLLGMFAVDWFLIRDTPGLAGHRDFETGDASYQDEGETPSLLTMATRMFSNPVIWVIVAVEFCSGFLRQAVMKQGRYYAAGVGALDEFVFSQWGLVMCVAGILGGIFAGLISDRVFQSRRGPVASVLYGGLLLGAVVALATLGSPATGWALAFMSLCVIGVHGMLSGTASMDFGGRKGAGMATGIIDGFVYLGTATQGFVYARLLPAKDAAHDPANWRVWPLAMIPVALVGLVLATRVWNAKPKKAGPHDAHAPASAPVAAGPGGAALAASGDQKR